MEGASAGHMLNALWNATLGYTLRFFWNPLDSAQTLIDDSAIDQLRAHGVRSCDRAGRCRRCAWASSPTASCRSRPRLRAEAELGARARAARSDRLVPRASGSSRRASVPTLRDPSAEQPAPGARDAALGAGQALLAGRRPGGGENYPDIEDRSPSWQRAVPAPAGREPARQAAVLHEGTFPRHLCGAARSPFAGRRAWVQRDPDAPEAGAAGRRDARSQLHRGAAARCSHGQRPDPRSAHCRCRTPNRCSKRCSPSPPTRRCCTAGATLFYDHVDKSPLIERHGEAAGATACAMPSTSASTSSRWWATSSRSAMPAPCSGEARRHHRQPVGGGLHRQPVRRG